MECAAVKCGVSADVLLPLAAGAHVRHEAETRRTDDSLPEDVRKKVEELESGVEVKVEANEDSAPEEKPALRLPTEQL